MTGENYLRPEHFPALEFLGVKHGLKPVARRGITPGMNTLLFEKKCREEKMEFKIVKSKICGRSGGSPLIYLSNSMDLIREAIEAERRGNIEKSGELFGYPKCCASFFVKNGGVENWPLVTAKASKKPFSYYLNNLFTIDSRVRQENSIRYAVELEKMKSNFFDLFYISHIPCSYNCRESIRLGRKMREILKAENPVLQKRIDEALKKSFVFFNDFDFCTLDGKQRGNSISYSSLIESLSVTKEDKMKLFAGGNEVVKDEGCVRVLLDGREIGKIEENAFLMDFR